MFKIIALIIVALIAVVLILAAMKPDVFRVQRTVFIKAAPEKIFPHLNDFHSFTKWSPYENKDPNMKRTFSGSPAGVGAVYKFEGDRNAGAGKLAIIESTFPQKVAMTLEFFKPFKANNVVEFTLVQKGDVAEAVWSMHGPVTYTAKIMHVFFNMDSMVGKDFEVGLKNLKRISEAE